MRKFSYLLMATGAFILWLAFEPTYEQEEDGSGAVEYTAELDIETTEELYIFACDFIQGQFAEVAGDVCPNIPVVIFRKMKDRLHGYYSPGSRIVWLSDKFSHQFSLSIFGEGIAIHEMVHYLLYEYELYEDDKDFCREENLAWTAANLWVEDKNRPEDANEEWWDWYDTCDGPHDDPNTTLRAKLIKVFT